MDQEHQRHKDITLKLEALGPGFTKLAYQAGEC